MNISAYEATKVVSTDAFLTSTAADVAYDGNRIHYYTESPADSDYALISVSFIRIGGQWKTLSGYCQISGTANPATLAPFGPGVIHVYPGAGEYDTWISSGNQSGNLIPIYDGTPI